MRQSGMALSSPARSPPLCIPWAKSVSVPWTGPPDTLAGRQLLSPTCHTAVAALLNGAGEREVKKLNLLTLPVFWCLGDGPTMHEEGALPGTPGRRVRALPMTDPLVSRPRADAQPQRPRPQVLVLACRRVCWALPGCRRARIWGAKPNVVRFQSLRATRCLCFDFCVCIHTGTQW